MSLHRLAHMPQNTVSKGAAGRSHEAEPETLRESGGELRKPLGERIAHMPPEGRLGLTYPLRLALAESPEGLLEPETRPTTLSPSRSEATSWKTLANSRRPSYRRQRRSAVASSCREPDDDRAHVHACGRR
jgi:hypothetical protein